jgi:hypothetical protein
MFLVILLLLVLVGFPYREGLSQENKVVIAKLNKNFNRTEKVLNQLEETIHGLI